MTTTMTTWREIEAGVLAGLPTAVVEDLRRVTAPARLAARASEVRRLARAWLEARAPEVRSLAREWLQGAGMTPRQEHVRALCALEAGGTRGGGRMDPGAGTARHPAFSTLPARRAMSGPAWTAAIAAVAGRWAWTVDDVGDLALVVRDGAGWSVPIPVGPLADAPECLAVAARRAARAAADAIWPPEPGAGGVGEEVLGAAWAVLAAAGRALAGGEEAAGEEE